MLKREFEEMTGIEVTDSEYKFIEAAYYVNDENKQVFCNTYKMADEARRRCIVQMGVAIKTQESTMAWQKKKKEHLLTKLFNRAQLDDNDALRKICADEMGNKRYINMILDSEYAIGDFDREIFKALMKSEEE